MDTFKRYFPTITALILGIVYFVIGWGLTRISCEKALNVSWDGRPSILCSIIGTSLIIFSFISLLMKSNFRGSSMDSLLHITGAIILIGFTLYYASVIQYPVHLECFYSNSSNAKLWPVSYATNFITFALMIVFMAQYLA